MGGLQINTLCSYVLLNFLTSLFFYRTSNESYAIWGETFAPFFLFLYDP